MFRPAIEFSLSEFGQWAAPNGPDHSREAPL
jgi:hypothetical protein